MAEGGCRPPRGSSVIYSRLGDSEDERAAAAAAAPAGVHYRDDLTDSGRAAWEDECQASPGLQELLQPRPRCPKTGYSRFGSSVPRLRVAAVSSTRSEELEEHDKPRWKLDLQVREPQLADIGCCNVGLGTRWKPYPVSFEISTMSDSPLLCANYMVARRSDEDFIRLYNSLRSQFTFDTRLMAELADHRPRRLAQISEDALTLQCGRHKKMLKWILSKNMFYSSHDLHAFIGCKSDSCPSQQTAAVKKFPQYPAGTRRRRLEEE